MNIDELVDVLFGWDGGLGRKSWSEVREALDEYTREVKAAAWDEGSVTPRMEDGSGLPVRDNPWRAT